MLKQITTLCIAVSCFMGNLTMHAALSCKPRAKLHSPVTRIIGTPWEVSYISLFLLSSGVSYVKPLELELWMKQLRNVMQGSPDDVHKIILEYADLSLESRSKRIFKKDDPNAAVFFHEYIGKWSQNGRSTICGEKFQQVVQCEEKKKDSAENLLYKIVHDISKLGNDYEPNPFEYIIGQQSEGGSCSICGKDFLCDIVSRKSDAIYRFSKNSLDLAFHKGETSITVTELLKRVMAFRKTSEQQCTCKSPVEVMSHDIFITTPSLLLLHFEAQPSQKIAIHEFIETPGQAPTRYQLHAAWRERFPYNPDISVQFKSSDKNWYIPQENAESVRHSPINWLGELGSFTISLGNAVPLQPSTYIGDIYYPKFLLYKKVHHHSTTSSCIIS
jgi:hypothetical protein